MATGRPWGQYLTAPDMTAWATFEQLGGAVPLAALDGRLAGHGVEQGAPGRAGVGGAAGEQAAGQLGEHVGDLPGGHVAGGGPDDQRPAAEVLRLKAEAPQQRELGQQGGPSSAGGVNTTGSSRACTMGW